MEPKQIQKPSAAFIGASWMALIIGILAFIIGLWNADMELNEKGLLLHCAHVWIVLCYICSKSSTRPVRRSEKGFYAMSFLLSMFAAIAVQKNTRDIKLAERNAEEKPF